LLACHLGSAPNRSERFAFGALDLGWIGAPPPLEVQMLANRVVKDAHVA
jgi:hypothetical protein